MADKKSNTPNIYDEFPFMTAFPFDEYEISIDKDTFYVDDVNVDFNSIPALNTLEEPEVVNFKYVAENNDIIISFHHDDIKYIDEVSGDINTLDGVRQIIDNGIASEDIKEKILAINAGNEFIERVSPAFQETHDTFKSVLDSIIKLNGVEMSHRLVQNILNLNKSINISKLNDREVKSIHMYLNFQLHHAKIILGVVIASKIY